MNNREQTNTQVVLVTGAYQGIGFEVCRQLARRGMTAILTARELDRATKSVKQLIEEGLRR